MVRLLARDADSLVSELNDYRLIGHVVKHICQEKNIS